MPSKCLPLVLLLGTAALTTMVSAGEAQKIVLREHLGRAWSNEFVTFPLNTDQQTHAKASRSLVDGNGNPTAFQLLPADGDVNARICLQVDLEPLATRSFRFSEREPGTASDLQVKETADEVRLWNSFTGIAVRKRMTEGQGPIAGVRLRSGTWAGGSAWSGKAKLGDCRVVVQARGPVIATASCLITSADGGSWRLDFSLQSREPVVRVDERFDLPDGGTFQVSLGDRAFRPTHLLYRSGKGGNLGHVCTWKAEPKGTAYTLEPWVRWWMNERQGNWFALYTPTPADRKTTEPADLLMVGALNPSAWKDPAWKGRASQVEPCVSAVLDDGLITLHFPVQGGRRIWMLGTPEQAPSLEPLARKDKRVSPLPQDYLIKHGDFPLDVVKDYVLEWNGDHENYPRLFVRKADLPALRERLAAGPKELRAWAGPIDRYQLGGAIRAFFATGDPALGKRMAAQAREWFQQCAERFLDQDVQVSLGVAPHMQTQINSALNALDPVMASEHVSPEECKRLLAQIAFLGYVVASEDYWSPRRGFRANPNMTTTVATYQTAIACMIPSHPRAKEWVALGLRELRDNQLNTWSDEDGGWMEAPHYAMVSYDHILGAFLMAANAGLGDHAYDERMRKVMEWFARISTPRDARTGGWRHLPAIGNTYVGERTGMFGIVAGLWKERDPKFAAQMLWMHREHGSFGPSGIGGFCPTMAGYRELLQDNALEPQPLECGSHWFRKTGVVLRSGFGTERETYLHLIAGPNHEHYDYDSGSLILWGKGRVLADDFGYIGRHPARWHSLVTSPNVSDGAPMAIDHFSAGPALDCVSGVKGAWRRQILFARDDDPHKPNFFALRDTHEADAPATWRLWLTAKSVKVHDAGATVEGEDDVDLDLFFFQPARLNLRTEATTQKTTCGFRDGKVGPLSLSQTAVVATLPGRGALTAVLFPRLKKDPAPKVTWLADGRGVKLLTDAGTDYVFASDEPFDCRDGDVIFQGQTGAVRLREASVTLSLGRKGKVGAAGKELVSETSAHKTEKR